MKPRAVEVVVVLLGLLVLGLAIASPETLDLANGMATLRGHAQTRFSNQAPAAGRAATGTAGPGAVAPAPNPP